MDGVDTVVEKYEGRHKILHALSFIPGIENQSTGKVVYETFRGFKTLQAMEYHFRLFNSKAYIKGWSVHLSLTDSYLICKNSPINFNRNRWSQRQSLVTM